MTEERLREIRVWLESRADTQQGREKYGKANSLRAQQVIARFGKIARYPVCQAGLQLWQLDAELLGWSKDIGVLAEVLSSAKKQKKQVRALYEQLYKERKQKEVIQAEALLHKVNEHLLKTQTAYQAKKELSTKWLDELRPAAVAQFNRERDVVKRSGDDKAQRALQRVRKQWSTNPNADGARLKDGDRRTFEILKMLHDQAIKAAFFKDGAISGYSEATFGGDRLLSDEFWQGRLTVRGIHSRLVALGGSRLAGDKDAKEIRRLLTRLGVRPAEDQRGRKWKPPITKKQKLKKPRGRSRIHPELEYKPDLAGAEADLESQHKVTRQDYSLGGAKWEESNWRPKGEKKAIAKIDQVGVKWARQVSRSIESEIKKLQLLRGGRKGRYVY